MTLSRRFLALTLALAGAACASKRAASSTAPSDGIRITTFSEQVSTCQLLGVVRVQDGRGMPTFSAEQAPPGWEKWADRVARRKAKKLGGDVVLRFAPPINATWFNGEHFDYDANRSDTAIIADVYRCGVTSF